MPGYTANYGGPQVTGGATYLYIGHGQLNPPENTGNESPGRSN